MMPYRHTAWSVFVGVVIAVSGLRLKNPAITTYLLENRYVFIVLMGAIATSRVEHTRKTPSEIRPTKGAFCVRIRPPVGDLLFVIEPGEKLSSKSAETFYYPTAKTHLTGSRRLACLLYVAKAMAIIEGPKKMSDDRQEWWRQQGEGYPWTTR